MADFSKYFFTLIDHEGGYVNDPKDKGGATKYGVTLATWVREGYDKNSDGKINKEDVKLISLTDAFLIAKENYWDVLSADDIENQSIAEFLFDFGYNSGSRTAAKKLQAVLGVVRDGVIGPKTIKALNNSNQEETFNKLKAARLNYVEAIVRSNPSQRKFLKGWRNRINSFEFSA